MLIFRKEDHTYWLGEKRLPSVSEIKEPLCDFSKVPPDVLERARLFGQAVHAMIQLEAENDLDEETLDYGLKGCLAAFRLWREEEGKRFYIIGQPCVEVPLFHPRLGYAGTPDLRWPGKTIVDIKTRPYNSITDPVQLAAYEELDKTDTGLKPGRNLLIVELRQNGTYKQTPAEHPAAFGIFRRLMEMRQIQAEIEAWKKGR